MELTIGEALRKAIEAHQEGRLQDAERFYRAILQTHPQHSDANHNLGVLAVSVGKIEDGLPFFKAALESNTTIEQFWLSYIDAFIKLERHEEAQKLMAEAKEKGFTGEAFDQLQKQNQSTLFSRYLLFLRLDNNLYTDDKFFVKSFLVTFWSLSNSKFPKLGPKFFLN